MKRISTAILIVAGFSLLLSSCVSSMGMTQSNIPLQGKTYEKLGTGEGDSSVYSVFGLWQVGHTDIDGAIKRAIAEKNGDALINITWQERTYWFILVGWHHLEVKGEVVKFTDDNGKKPVRRRGR